MRVVILILVNFVLFADIYIDKNPSKITLEDLKIIEQFDKNAMDIAERGLKEQVNPLVISNYIWKHRAFQDDYTRLTVDLEGESGRRTARYDAVVGDSLFPNEYNYYKAGVNIKYNIYDDKTSKELNNNMLDYKSKIILAVQLYAKEKEAIYILNEQLELERLKQLRMKVMVMTAQKYLDDRIKNIEALMTLRHKILETRTVLEIKKLELLNMVQEKFKNSLEQLL